MAKATKKTSTADTSEQQAVEQALRIAYQVGRYEWLNGRPMSAPMVPVAIPAPPTKPRKIHAQSQRDRVQRALSSVDLFPHGTDGIQPAVIVRAVQEALKSESDLRRTVVPALADNRKKPLTRM